MEALELVGERRAVAMAFLQRVLPSHGMYFASTLSHNRWRRYPCLTLNELWDILSTPDVDTYFSTASFKDNSSSASSNIEAIQAFRIDVDCGPKDGYLTPNEGMIAILQFSKAANLPPPGLVLSGHGVHAWWPLTTMLSRSAWERYAEGLKNVCKTHGLKQKQKDISVTTDAARVLRCPGTFNYKNASVPVEVTLHNSFFKCGPYDTSLFSNLCDTNVVELRIDENLERPAVETSIYSPAMIKYYASMLATIPVEDRDDRRVWLETGMALYELGWGDVGLMLWSLWSKRSQKYDEREQHRMWMSFGRPYDGAKITIGSLVQRATQHGWRPLIEPLKPVPNGDGSPLNFEQPVQLSAERLKKERAWNLSSTGKIQNRNYQNTRIAFATLDIRARYNVFLDKKDAIIPWISSDWLTFSDDLIAPIRKQIVDYYKFDPGKDCVVDVLEEFAVDGSYDPVVNYLNNLQWDGIKRLNTWLINYTGAADNKLIRYFGLVTIIAAVRRAFHPGTKFDHMLILEGDQGTGKSSVVEILGRKDYYKNQSVNFQDPRSIIEALNGAWFYEWAELAGMRRAESERLKAMLSTSVDCARMAYGRMVTIRPRRCVIIGTTNAVLGEYLTDYTGGRRYWPVVTKKIELNNLRRDVDQLFAEAVIREKEYGLLTLPESLLKNALWLQKSRTQKPEWTDLLADVKGQVYNTGTPLEEERIAAKDVITQWLKLTPAQMNSNTYRSVSNAMRELGWMLKTLRINGNMYRGYMRPTKFTHVENKWKLECYDDEDISD